MKIIDIFNNIASGEDVPRKIKYDGKIWEYKDSVGDYRCEDDEPWLFTYLFDNTLIKYFIDYKVEVLNEDNKMKKWGKIALQEMENKSDYTINDLKVYIKILAATQNEIIDEIKKLNKSNK